MVLEQYITGGDDSYMITKTLAGAKQLVLEKHNDLESKLGPRYLWITALLIVIVVLFIWLLKSNLEGMGNAAAAQQNSQGYFGESFTQRDDQANPIDLKPSREVIIDGKDSVTGFEYRNADTDMWRENAQAGAPFRADRPRFYLLRDTAGIPVRDDTGYVVYVKELQMVSTKTTDLLPNDTALKVLRTNWNAGDNLRNYAATCESVNLLDSDPYSWLQRSKQAGQNLSAIQAANVGKAGKFQGDEEPVPTAPAAVQPTQVEGMRANMNSYRDADLLPAAYGQHVGM